MPPYNPITYDLLLEANKYNHILIAEDYLINFAKLNDVDLKGSYNPHKYDLTYQDFYDGVHGRDLVLKKIFDPVLWSKNEKYIIFIECPLPRYNSIT